MADLRRYELAPIGLEYFERKDIGAAKASLDNLLKSISATVTDPNLKDDFKIIGEGSEASKEGIATALSGYGKKYLDAVKNSNLGDFWDVYKDEFNDAEKRVYGAKISRFSGLKLEELEKEIKTRQDRLAEILDNNLNVPAAEINTLNDELNHYNEAYQLIAKAQEIRVGNLKLKVYTDARKEENDNSKKEMRSIIGIK
ncbi:MAG: hypothetical protein WC584_00595 [Candidatus Pacearchaeota archaeon]